jgi:hypothetical protein
MPASRTYEPELLERIAASDEQAFRRVYDDFVMALLGVDFKCPSGKIPKNLLK